MASKIRPRRPAAPRQLSAAEIATAIRATASLAVANQNTLHLAALALCKLLRNGHPRFRCLPFMRACGLGATFQ